MKVKEAIQILPIGTKELTIKTTLTIAQIIALSQEQGHVFILTGFSHSLDSGEIELHFKPGNGVSLILKQYEITESDTLLEDYNS